MRGAAFIKIRYVRMRPKRSGAGFPLGRRSSLAGGCGLAPDLREHAIGSLTAELFGLHDRARVEIFACYCVQPR